MRVVGWDDLAREGLPEGRVALATDLVKVERLEGGVVIVSAWAFDGCREWVKVDPPADGR